MLKAPDATAPSLRESASVATTAQDTTVTPQKAEMKPVESKTVGTANRLPNQNTTKTMPPITELMMKDDVVGKGAEAKAGDSVTVNYVGALTNGTVFDASKNHGNEGFTFTLGAGQVIKGWDVGVVGMKVGGKRQLLIPANMAYGDRAVGGVIPANSALIFEVELLKTGR